MAAAEATRRRHAPTERLGEGPGGTASRSRGRRRRRRGSESATACGWIPRSRSCTHRRRRRGDSRAFRWRRASRSGSTSTEAVTHRRLEAVVLPTWYGGDGRKQIAAGFVWKVQ